MADYLNNEAESAEDKRKRWADAIAKGRQSAAQGNRYKQYMDEHFGITDEQRKQAYLSSGMDRMRIDLSALENDIRSGTARTARVNSMVAALQKQRAYFQKYADYFTAEELRGFEQELSGHEQILTGEQKRVREAAAQRQAARKSATSHIDLYHRQQQTQQPDLMQRAQRGAALGAPKGTMTMPADTTQRQALGIYTPQEQRQAANEAAELEKTYGDRYDIEKSAQEKTDAEARARRLYERKKAYFEKREAEGWNSPQERENEYRRLEYYSRRLGDAQAEKIRFDAIQKKYGEAKTLENLSAQMEEITKKIAASEENEKKLERQRSSAQHPGGRRVGNAWVSTPENTEETDRLSKAIKTEQRRRQALQGQQSRLAGDYQAAYYYKYTDLQNREDFDEKSQYKTTRKTKEEYKGGLDDLYRDVYYDYINGDKDAQTLVDKVQDDDSTRTTHEYWKNLPEETVSIFNYLYATEGKDAAYEYLDLTVDKEYTWMEAIGYGLAQGTGLASLYYAGKQGAASFFGLPGAEKNAVMDYRQFQKDTAGAAQDNPVLYYAGSTVGNLGLMAATGAGAGKLVGTAGGAIGSRVATGALSFATAQAIRDAGGVATGELTAGEYGKNILVSGIQGAAGNLASELVSSGIAKKLTEKGMMTPFMEWVRNTASGMTFATVNQAIGYLAADEKPTAGEVVSGLISSFAFSMIDGGLRTLRTTRAAKQQLEQMIEDVKAQYTAMSANSERLTQEQAMERAAGIYQYSQQIRETLDGMYLAGQQETADQMRGALDFIQSWATDFVAQNMPGQTAGTQSGAPAAGGTLLPETAGAAQEVQQLQKQLTQAMTEGAQESEGNGQTLPQQTGTEAGTNTAGTGTEQPTAETGAADTAEAEALPTAKPNQGKEETNHAERKESESLPDRDGGRVAGVGAGGQAGVLREGRPQRAAEQSRTAIQRQNTARSLKLQKVSSASLGLEQGTDEKNLQIYPIGAWDEELKQTVNRLEEESGKHVTVVIGQIQIRAGDALKKVRGVYNEQQIIVQADNLKLTVDQIGDHELMHHYIRENPGLAQQVEQAIIDQYGQEELDAAIGKYVERMRGIVNIEEGMSTREYDEAMQRVKNEIICDAYAGINAFDAHAERYQTATKETMTQRGVIGRRPKENAAALQRRGVGEGKPEYSIERTTDNRAFVEVEQDILAGVPEADWVNTVKENLKKKFPNGITVGNSEINIDYQSRQEMTFSRYMQWLYNNDPQLRADKLRATDNADEILQATTGWVNEGLKHPRKDTIRDFARGEVLLRVGGNDYAADVVVGTRKNGSMVMYDVLNLQPTSFTKKETDAAIAENPSPGTNRSTASFSETSIAGNGKNVNSKYSYGGERSKTANMQSLREAQEMEQLGAAMESIREATGWHKGRDGKWRYEIDDSAAEYRRDGDARLLQEESYRRLIELSEKWDASIERGGEELTPAEEREMEALEEMYSDRLWEEKYELQDFLKHDKLYEAYPMLRHTTLQFRPLDAGVNGYYSKRDDTITLSNEFIGKPMKTLLHEIQHAIQRYEGFSGGASPAYWNRRLENGFDGRTAKAKREGAKLQAQYEQMRESDPQFVAAMEELNAMAPTVPRGKIDFDTLEQIEPDPPEWVRYDERRDQLEKQYGERVWDWYSLRDSIDRNARSGDRLSTDLYRDTAGEIEARDSAARSGLTAEQRRELPPDYGDENTVLAEGGVGYSIGEIVDPKGNAYGRGVRLDSTLLEGLTDKERAQMVKERVKELGGQHFTAYDNNGNAVNVQIAKPNDRFINKSGKKVLVNKDLTTKNSSVRVKQEAVVLADELITTANYQKSTAAKYPHGWLDNNGQNDWERWKTYLQDKENTVWEATLHIATSANGEKILYDIDSIKKAGRSGKSDATPAKAAGSGKSDSNTADSSIARKNSAVKSEYSLEASEDGEKVTAANNLSVADLREALGSGAVTLTDDDRGEVSIIYRKGAETENGTVALSDIQQVILPRSSPLGVFRDLEDLGVRYADYSAKEDGRREQLVNAALGVPDRPTEADRQRKQDESLDRERIQSLLEAETAREAASKRSDDKQPEEAAQEGSSDQKKLPGKRKKTTKPVAESRPIIAKQDLKKNLLNLFSIPQGMRAEMGGWVDHFADKIVKNGALTQEERDEFFDRMYAEGVVEVAADEYYRTARQDITGRKIYVPDEVKHEFGDDWNQFRKGAFAAGVILTNQQNDEAIDALNMELAENLPGLFDANETDMRAVLERLVQIAEEGKDESMSLSEYAKWLTGQDYVSEEEVLNNVERQMDWALRTFAEKAGLEIKLRDRTGVKIAQEREKTAEARKKSAEARGRYEEKTEELKQEYDERVRKIRERETLRKAEERQRRKELNRAQRERRELRELQQRTLTQLQWLAKNQYRAPEELRGAWDEVLSDIDIYAVGAANAMNWSNKYNAEWKDLAEMYKEAKKSDPNFLPSKELERIVARLDNRKIEDMDLNALQDLYKAAVGLRTEFYNRNNVIGDESSRMFGEVYEDSKEELAEGARMVGAERARKGNKMEKFLNLEQLSPMNVMERMGGWNPNGTFYSMAKQLEKGERDVRAYTVRANKELEDVLTEYADFVRRADGQGKDAIWYEIEVPELLELGMGDKPIFGETIKVYMTPSQKIHMYLESKNYENLRHMAGGRTFADKELYSQGKRREAFAQGKTIRMAPETVKALVRNMTPEEQAIADALERYYNQFAKREINRVSNLLYGYDKAVGRNYAPIYTNTNYTKSEMGVYNATAEGVGNLKQRQQSKNPSYNIGAFDAFERHVEQTARFVGMAIPARNWQTLLNWRERDDSMADVITHTWGEASLKYIEDVIQMLQGEPILKSDSVSRIIDKVFSNYISAVFGANPSIVLKQTGSIPLAGVWLDFKNVPSIGQTGRIDRELIGRYTQELAWRTMGYSTPETKQLKENPNWSQRNKAVQFAFGGGAITAMDGWAASVLWPWAENKVRREYPELEAGTQEEIEKGESKFYKKVAEVFNEAVLKSQSSSDIMSQGLIRQSKNPVTRFFTLFGSDSGKIYNAWRQTSGEAKYYKKTGNKAAYRKAKRRAGLAVLVATGGYLLTQTIAFLMNLWKHKGKAYRDDEGNLTFESVAKKMTTGLFGDLAGVVVGGEELADAIGDIVTGSEWDDMELLGLGQVNEIVAGVIKKITNIGSTVQDIADVLENKGSVMEYLRRHSGDIIGGIKETAQAGATYLVGLPVNNLESYLLGTVKWASPELATAYEDALQTPAKGDLKGLTGDALAQRVGSIFSTRDVELDDAEENAVAALYAAGFPGAVPADTPSSVTVDGESRELSAYQKQTYDKVWSATVNGALQELLASEGFQSAGDAEKEKMLKGLYSYAGEQAKAVLFEDYTASTEKADAVLQAGGSMTDWLTWVGASGALEPEDGKESVSATQKYELLRGMDYDDGVKYAIAGSIMGTEQKTDSGAMSQYAKMLEVQKDGLSADKYLELRVNGAVDKYLKQKENGASTETAYKTAIALDRLPSDAKPVEQWRTAIRTANGQKEQLAALKGVMTQTQYDKVEIATYYSIRPETWVQLNELLPEFDEDGNGSYNKGEIENAIEALSDRVENLEFAQKAALWQLMTGSTSARSNPYNTHVAQEIIDERSKRKKERTAK